MIEFKTGDLLSEDVDVLVNTVNCVGVMGRGIALQFKKAFPQNFQAYAQACKRSELKPGNLFVFETMTTINPRYIVNFQTKRHWRGNSRMEDIEAGLIKLNEWIRERDIRSIAIPPLGSGLGGLQWSDVRRKIEYSLRDIENVQVVVFEPYDTQEAYKSIHFQEVPVMTPARAALVGLVHSYLIGLVNPFVTLLEVHKLMYFLQIAGEPLQLRFAKGPFGPYAENLRHLLHKIEGHFISGYADGGDRPEKTLELVPGAIEDAIDVLNQSTDTKKRFDKVTALIEGFESPYGLELLSTVHWIINNESIKSRKDLRKQVYEWSKRKQKIPVAHIDLAVQILETKHWI